MDLAAFLKSLFETILQGTGYFLIVGGLIAIYFLPTMLANSRNHHNAAPITIINILAGWTLLGWFIALVWSTTHVINTEEK